VDENVEVEQAVLIVGGAQTRAVEEDGAHRSAVACADARRDQARTGRHRHGELGGDQLGELVVRGHAPSSPRKGAVYPLRRITGAPDAGVNSSPSRVKPQSRCSSSSCALWLV